MEWHALILMSAAFSAEAMLFRLRTIGTGDAPMVTLRRSETKAMTPIGFQVALAKRKFGGLNVWSRIHIGYGPGTHTTLQTFERSALISTGCNGV
ncbi:hypothetical protein EDE09_11375 [Neorhizobium sp. S3-V5DH]|nr:hypothetical protein EDE09_11375 [Neorhizobium sp. S3-V5DH]